MRTTSTCVYSFAHPTQELLPPHSKHGTASSLGVALPQMRRTRLLTHFISARSTKHSAGRVTLVLHTKNDYYIPLFIVFVLLFSVCFTTRFISFVLHNIPFVLFDLFLALMLQSEFLNITCTLLTAVRCNENQLQTNCAV